MKMRVAKAWLSSMARPLTRVRCQTRLLPSGSKLFLGSHSAVRAFSAQVAS
jgi:hypothetical protein